MSKKRKSIFLARVSVSVSVSVMAVTYTGCGVVSSENLCLSGICPSSGVSNSGDSSNGDAGGASVSLPSRSTACSGVTYSGGVSLLAGQLNGPGTLNGTGLAARFAGAAGVAVDSSGNLYVADTGNHMIRKVTPAGVVTTFAGSSMVSGSADGTGTAAKFNAPKGITVDSSGTVYVADTGNYTIRKITPAGVVTTIAGTAGSAGTTNGTGDVAKFGVPYSIAADSSGNLYVAESYRKIRKIVPGATAATTTVSVFAGTGVQGNVDGAVGSATFYDIQGIAVDGSGNIYVSDYSSHLIRMISGGQVVTIAGTGIVGSTDGAGSVARFRNPLGLTVDNLGYLYVADSANFTIRKIVPGATAAATTVSTWAGVVNTAGSLDAAGTSAKFYSPNGLAVDGSGNLYVADVSNSLIRKISSGANVTTLAGNVYKSGLVDGQGSVAKFNLPWAMTLDSSCNIFVVDVSNNTIRKVTPSGVVSIFAGSSTGSSGSSDGSTTSARFNTPRGIVADSSDNLYVTDSNNHTIRKITPSGDVTTFAGTVGSAGVVDGADINAKFNVPRGITIDSSGNLYVTDTSGHTIRRVNSAGGVTTIAGIAGSSGSTNGTGDVAKFNQPNGIAWDGAGNLYVAEFSNHLIRKIVPGATAVDTTVSTFAGSGTAGYFDATGIAAQFNSPIAVAANTGGDVYVGESGNPYLRKISSLGEVTTFVGKPYTRGVVLSNTTLTTPLNLVYGVAISGSVIFVTTENTVLTVGP